MDSAHHKGYDLDTPTDRRGTASLKWDFPRRYTGLEGPLLPLWVADIVRPVWSRERP